MTTTSTFDRFKTAQASNGGHVYFQPGEYVYKISEVKFDKSKKIPSKPVEFFALSGTLVVADPIAPHPDMVQGREVSWITMDNQLPYNNNVKAVWCALCGIHEAELDADNTGVYERLFAAMVGPEQLATGRLLQVHAVNVKTKAGKDFTAMRWTAVPEEDQQIKRAAMIAALK